MAASQCAFSSILDNGGLGDDFHCKLVAVPGEGHVEQRSWDRNLGKCCRFSLENILDKENAVGLPRTHTGVMVS